MKNIKKSVAFALALVVLLSLASCLGKARLVGAWPSSGTTSEADFHGNDSDSFNAFQTSPKSDAAVVNEEFYTSDDSKPSTGHKIGLRYYPFNGTKIITITAFMSQLLSDREKNNGISGYPVFEVYEQTDIFDTEKGRYEPSSDPKIIINGENANFEKDFSLSSLNYLVSTSMDEDVFESGHSEAVTLDFGNFNTGECVTISFSYGFFYYKNNPYNQKTPDNSWVGKRATLFFYIGEEGISIDQNSIQGAKDGYTDICENIKEFGRNPSDDVII